MTRMTYPRRGDRFGRYDVGEVLGRGGMGVVHLARHRDLQREVALKLLSPHLADDADHRRRFEREAQALGRLRSPHVIAVHDAGEQDGMLFIATELVRGGDLEKLLASSGPARPLVALQLVAEVADGLAAAHSAGVLHRDIKPSNVLLRRSDDGTGQAVLCDLGISQLVDVHTQTTAGVAGTLGYMAPERHDGAPATEASDVYSVGCLLWALLAGRAPYVGTDARVAMGHLYGPVRQLAVATDAERELNRLLARAMAKLPGERHPSAAALAADAREVGALFGPLESLTAPPPEPTPITPPQKTSVSRAGRRRRRARLAVAATVAAVVAVGVVTAVLLATRDDEPSADSAGARPQATEPGGGTETEPGTEASKAPPTSYSPDEAGFLITILPSDSQTRFEQIRFDGIYSGPDGTTLEIQERFPGGWRVAKRAVFVEDGEWTAFLQTTQTGRVQLRAYDPEHGLRSNVVTVRVRPGG